jgi:putative ABC transport system substrate-binding protein
MPAIGFLSPETPDLFADRMRSFRGGLGEVGYIEGQNVSIEYRWAAGQIDQLPALADELVHAR